LNWFWLRQEFIFFIVAHTVLCFGFVTKHSVDSAPDFLLLLSRAYTASRPLLFLTRPCQRGGWGCKEVGRGHRQDSWPHL